MNRVLRLCPAALLLLVTTTACDAAASTPPTAVPTPQAVACTRLPDAVLPHSAGMLTEQQTGAYCLPRGERVDVFLTAAKGGQWQPVHASGDGVLAPTSTGVMTAPLGVTPAMFIGATDGTAVLTSGTASGATWKVTVVVKG
ncbi:hypothetical protein ABIA32_001603 [Streptacidiphilus sp. MAP12-20]|uniref:hypothetical protein n=1 Tax=Streptacidiphilus sp. MAP12-20 TaxID=3156299 RepID=UPI0035140B5B